MKKHCYLLLSFVLFFSPSIRAQDSLSARQIIEKNIEAQGGRAALESIRTVYTEFSTTIEGHQVHVIIKEMLPNKGSFEIVYESRTVYRSFFDGKQGYGMVHGQMEKEPADDFKDKFYKKNIFDELDYLDTTLYSITLLPDSSVGEEAAYVIQTTLKNSAERRIYYSKKTFLELLTERTALAETQRSNMTLIEKQNKYQNIMYPSLQKVNVGTDQEETLTLLKIYFNEKVTEADFQ